MSLLFVRGRPRASLNTVPTSLNPNLGKATTPDKARAAGQHDFLVANMFGPIEWDIDSSTKKDAGETVLGTKRRDRVPEANMFGPMDWAPLVLEAENRLEKKRGSAIKPASMSVAHGKAVS